MRVTLEYFGPARDATGAGRESVEVVGPSTAAELVARIARERGGRLASLLLVDNKLSSSVMVAVNDQQAGPMPLKDGDVVAIIPPISGGAN